MKGKICSIPYINKIRDNVLDINLEQIKSLYEDFRAHDCIIGLGSGRSLHAMNIPLSQMAMMKNPKRIRSPDDVGFPGADLYEAAPVLEKEHNRILALNNSGSGESEDPHIESENLAKYIEETNTKKFTIDAITSQPNSSIGKIAQRYGHILELKGRKGKEIRQTIEPKEYSETGIMRDIYELGSCFMLQMLAEALYKNIPADAIPEMMEKEFSVLGETVDNAVNSEAYNSAIDVLERSSHVFGGAKGTGKEVINMTLVRLFHIKRFLGDNVYIARGVNTPRPRAGDLQLLVSYSGETRPVVDWCNIFRSLGGIVFSIIGNRDSLLGKLSDRKIVLEERIKPGQPRRFYMRAAYALSPITVKLIEKLSVRGLKLPEYVLNYYHSVTE